MTVYCGWTFGDEAGELFHAELWGVQAFPGKPAQLDPGPENRRAQCGIVDKGGGDINAVRRKKGSGHRYRWLVYWLIAINFLANREYYTQK